MLSLLDHTHVGLAYNPKRQARGSGHPRPCKRSHSGIRNIYREYAQYRKYADAESGVKASLYKKDNIIPNQPRFDIAFLL